MYPTESAVSNALEEVWKWKAAVYEETKDMTFAEKESYLRKGMEDAAQILGAHLERNPDGTYSLDLRPLHSSD